MKNSFLDTLDKDIKKERKKGKEKLISLENYVLNQILFLVIVFSGLLKEVIISIIMRIKDSIIMHHWNYIKEHR